jgi:CPA1 family monovalent cation:H+ antiporter
MDLIIEQTLALMVVAIFVAIIARRLSLPYTVGLVVAGAALAFSRYDTGIRLTHDIIFDVILPPLLFEAAVNIPWHELRRDMIPVLVLSVFGVVISAAVVSAGMTWLWAWPFASALVFGVLIAATDPVAVSPCSKTQAWVAGFACWWKVKACSTTVLLPCFSGWHSVSPKARREAYWGPAGRC